MPGPLDRKWLALPALALLLASAPLAAGEADVELADEKAMTLYALGAALGLQLQEFALSEEEFEIVGRGVQDAALERELRVDLAEMQEEVIALQSSRQARRAEKERTLAQAYVDEAARREGAVRTESGMVIRHLRVGQGASPDATSVVKVHYEGSLRDDSVFDSTLPTGTPATFRLDRVIRCWREGLMLMKVGGKSELVCPPALGYGDSGFPPVIPPGAALQFEVELIEIVR